MVAALLRARAFWPTPVREVTRYVGGVLPVPGSPHVVFTPGHTLGHCALHFPDRDTVIVGDAVVMLDPYTAETGWPERPPRTRSAHSSRSTPWPTPGATTVLTGHGEAWRGGVVEAVARARRAGAF